MEVVEIDVDTLADDGAHEGETPRGQTISTRCVGASRPFGAREVNLVELAENV